METNAQMRYVERYEYCKPEQLISRALLGPVAHLTFVTVTRPQPSLQHTHLIL